MIYEPRRQTPKELGNGYAELTRKRPSRKSRTSGEALANRNHHGHRDYRSRRDLAVTFDEVGDVRHHPQGVGELGGDAEARRQIVEQGHFDFATAALVPLDQVLLHLERVVAIHAALDDQGRRK